MIQRFLLALLAVILAACAPHPAPPAGHDWRVTPTQEAVTMWRFRFGHPATSALLNTVTATQAQVASAGLTITLDEWGGCKDVTWQGLTGPDRDRARVWVDVADAAAPGGWRTLFSGTLTRRPDELNGQWEAVGDKYLRLKEIPVTRVNYINFGTEISEQMRGVIDDARADLPHLTYTATSLPDSGVLGQRQHNGESVAAALDGLIALKSGWSWTVRADDRVWIGPPPSTTVTVNAAVTGVRIQLKEVVSEGLLTAVRWIWRLPGDPRDPSRIAPREIVYESQHPRIAELGRSSVTRYIDQRSAPSVVQLLDGTYTLTPPGGAAAALSESEVTQLRDSATTGGVPLNGGHLTYTTAMDADWVEWAGVIPAPGTLQMDFYALDDTYLGNDFLGGGDTAIRTNYWQELVASAGYRRFDLWNISGDTAGIATELIAKRLDRELLDASAEQLYRVPSQHVGIASVPGIQEQPGMLTVQRPGRADITEKVVGVRYLIREPMRTEYVIGQPDESYDAQVLKVVVDRQDQQAVSQAVNTRGPA
ncbi:hypothetical protein [Deinococcus sp. 12RED42]|uniref:hypothetical protein n=1 Tax=Deinococcus sp. 12RED42 TaxID=2745872 RepID=UPI001E418FAC|nr:hypothetical protein [Deinococcus sp. 12RED42]MCD0165125.1 hypothetical protein [Deinococcus sp. 12RED42]